MGFIKEYVPRADWDLYNSFELVNKSINIGEKKLADEHSIWSVDRARELYFIMTGAVSREGIEYYTLIWQGKKVNIIAEFERRFENGMQKGYKVSMIMADKRLESEEKELLSIIQEILSKGWENGLDFLEISEPKYREKIK